MYVVVAVNLTFDCYIYFHSCTLFLGNAHFFVLIYRHVKLSNGVCQNHEINAINWKK